MFNALNAISNRMREDVDAADRMISNLGDLLRAAYDTDNHTHVPLQREREWLHRYASMMSERFRGQLNFQLEVEPGIESVTVPRLLLQPIVENAFRHGLAAGHGTLFVTVQRMGKRVRYTVSDDGAGLRGAQITHGTGLSNVSRRLELLFGSDHELLLTAREARAISRRVRRLTARGPRFRSSGIGLSAEAIRSGSLPEQHRSAACRAEGA